jgi:hypothetical protein
MEDFGVVMALAAGRRLIAAVVGELATTLQLTDGGINPLLVLVAGGRPLLELIAGGLLPRLVVAGGRPLLVLAAAIPRQIVAGAAQLRTVRQEHKERETVSDTKEAVVVLPPIQSLTPNPRGSWLMMIKGSRRGSVRTRKSWSAPSVLRSIIQTTVRYFEARNQL